MYWVGWLTPWNIRRNFIWQLIFRQLDADMGSSAGPSAYGKSWFQLCEVGPEAPVDLALPPQPCGHHSAVVAGPQVLFWPEETGSAR